jgi:hypothetical protein
MPTISFSGKVVPIPVPVTAGLSDLPSIRFEAVDTKEVETYTVKITESHVVVLIEVDNYSTDDIQRHRNKSLDLARTALDLFCFQSGWGLFLYLDRFVDPSGKIEAIVPGHPELAKLVNFRSNLISGLYPVFAADPRLHMALNDMIQAITWPHVATVNCARAVEGIRTIIAPGKRSAGWPAMQEALNITESYTRMITALSEAPRHGDRVWNPPEPIEEIIQRSWEIMMRYLEWESRGEKPLPKSIFRLLS